MSRKLPKTLYVKIVHEGDESYFVADEAKYGLGEMGETIKVGTYQLTEIETVEVVLKTTKTRS